LGLDLLMRGLATLKDEPATTLLPIIPIIQN
jgi:hypothetical protein